jgi:eukaryotic-like serine/threonine-protein kinase
MNTISSLPALDAPAYQPGHNVGPYTLARCIGRGGMSEVWQAHRSDGELKRDVALKLPFTGHFDTRLLTRFSRERDILARLDHPNIARLYDAGVAQSQPYLALELVEGVPIQDYCATHALSLRERVALFAQVIDAVQYAHVKLLVHRDIKPSNILVTGDGVVKLLDFGIAKPTERDGQETFDILNHTRLAGRALTPNYASPEQIRGELVSTASDIYSLGVVLYELLTGLTPYPSLRAPNAALAAPEREAIALNETATRPSSSGFDEAFASSCGENIKYLRRSLSDGLDAVLLTALTKEPHERYETARAFGDDLQAWLDGRPVSAQSPSQSLVAQKFFARHQLATGLGTLALTAVLASTGAALWQAQRATAAVETTNQVKQFLVETLSAFSGRKAGDLSAQANRQTSAEQMLQLASNRLQLSAGLSPEVRKELAGVLGDLTFEFHMNDEAIRLRQQRVQLSTNAKEKADAQLSLIDAYYQAGKPKEADQQLEAARALLPQFSGEAAALLDARLRMRSGRQLDFANAYKQSVPLLKEVAQTLRAIDPNNDEWVEAQSLHLNGLRLTDPTDARNGYEELLKIVEGMHGKDSAALIPVLRHYSTLLARQRFKDKAEVMFARLEALHDSHPNFDPVGKAVMYTEQGAMLRVLGDLNSARARMMQAAQMYEKLGLGDHPADPLANRTSLAELESVEWNFATAEANLQRAEKIARAAGRPLYIVNALELRALNATAQGNTDAVRMLFHESRTMRLQSLPPTHDAFTLTEARMIENEAVAGNIDDAVGRYFAMRDKVDFSKRNLLAEAQFTAMSALLQGKRWADYIRDSERLVDAPQSKQRKILLMTGRAQSFTMLGNHAQALNAIEAGNSLAAELGDALLPTIRVRFLLQQALSLAAAKAKPEVIAKAKAEFLALRAQLKGESAPFTRAAAALL